MAAPPRLACCDSTSRSGSRYYEAAAPSGWDDIAAAPLRALGDESRPVAGRAVGELSRREVEVLRLLGEDLPTPKSPDAYVSSIPMKLGLRNRTRAAALARIHRASAATSA